MNLLAIVQRSEKLSDFASGVVARKLKSWCTGAVTVHTDKEASASQSTTFPWMSGIRSLNQGEKLLTLNTLKKLRTSKASAPTPQTSRTRFNGTFLRDPSTTDAKCTKELLYAICALRACDPKVSIVSPREAPKDAIAEQHSRGADVGLEAATPAESARLPLMK